MDRSQDQGPPILWHPAGSRGAPGSRIQLSAVFSDSDFSRGGVDLDIRYGAVRGGRPTEQSLRHHQLVPVFADGKGVEVHAHHIVYPKRHGKWKKGERFVACCSEAGKDR